MDGNRKSNDGSQVDERELIVRFPAAKIRFGIEIIIVSVPALMLAVPVAFCLWLLLLFVSHVLFLAGWGSGDLLLIHGETSWFPVAGAGLAILTVALPPAWLIARIGAHWWRRVRNAWWLRLSSDGLRGQRPHIRATSLSSGMRSTSSCWPQREDTSRMRCRNRRRPMPRRSRDGATYTPPTDGGLSLLAWRRTSAFTGEQALLPSQFP